VSAHIAILGHQIYGVCEDRRSRGLSVDGLDCLFERRRRNPKQAGVGLTEFEDQEYRTGHCKCAERERSQCCGVNALVAVLSLEYEDWLITTKVGRFDAENLESNPLQDLDRGLFKVGQSR
jgi:hypothetical protein